MTLERAATPTFANHQTFHPRFGWIKKGHDAAQRDPNIFNEKFAPVELGVGKNMAEAIRFWATATKVVARRPHPDRPRISVYTPTRLGRALLDERFGLDPYLEDPATLWMLHWHAVSQKSVLPVWRLVFNDLGAIEFSEIELLQYCLDEIAATTWSPPMKSSVQKDVDCLLRMYSRRSTQGRQTLDDLLDSPFRELGLIQPSPGARKNTYRIVRGAKPTLPSAAVTYACLDYLSRTADGSKTITLTTLAADPGSPGRIMKLTEQDIADAVEDSSSVVGHLRLVRPAGSRQLAVSAPLGDVAFELLAARHTERRAVLPSSPDFSLVGKAATAPYLTDPEIERAIRKAHRSRARRGGDAA
ncbi:DUF4007 family protein [Mycobacterium asiaticum]|uniref:DUF4007 domain-containing protein n=1 Tax=Mycobacterium asiaticum TaxID=1790 RepID=A0A1A3NJR4_MYCAS|nr:DUF4007 family protein [Mycobacterium asiaticum]OBK22398.1 hypothetical protein A5635_21865 [Mycobacterium asiaticum]